jgi:hypothetical protein
VDRSTPTDLDLLRCYEPVVRFTKGELFLPTAVGPYVEQCSLWTGIHGERQSMLAPRGEMNIERLAREGVAHGTGPYSCALSRSRWGAGSMCGGDSCPGSG